MVGDGSILITGGAGYIGSHTVLVLLENGYDIIVLDNLVNAWKDDSVQIPEVLQRVERLSGKKITFYQVDLVDKDGLSEVFKQHKIDCVIHFAALKAVGESCQEPLKYYSNNVSGSITLFKVMKEQNVKNLVYSSSSTVYGSPEYLPLCEKHPTGRTCTNPYGKSKYFVEEILRDLVTSDKGWNVISLRYFNPVGAHPSGDIGEDPTGTPNNLMPYVAQVAIGRRKELLVFGNDYDTPDGTGVRDYIHIMDLAEGHVVALQNLLKPSSTDRFNVFNLGTGRGYSVLEVINAFSEVSGRKINYRFVARREGDIAVSYCSPNLAKDSLGWTAKRGLKDMCEDMWRWQTKNPNGFNKDQQPSE
ncbi:hypothetical protein LSTR_LSTR011466 [Laodelphax striatellus]|uniref:UDP-glucose 4-epimerase n=1 Tax=Laodelphax striatellus TaxID=195883 RepID=A0A482WHL8_LAOST|nr:hypothetical protein LSTR_LSTR011466 [Laodelphax striatellus]